MSKNTENVPVKKATEAPPGDGNPWQSLVQLRRDMDRIFDGLSSQFLGSRFFRYGMEIEPFKWLGEQNGKLTPAVDLVEKEKEFLVTAEVPGMDEKDIDITVSGGMLTIKGEKREEKEEKKKDYFLSERRYGSFHRSLRLPEGIDTDKIQAKFTKGVINVTLPKKAEGLAKEKKIAIAAE